jgi:hypothetical protein
MTKFVLAYHGSGEMPETEEEMAAMMGLWESWFASLGDNIVDGGNPVAQARTVNGDGSVSDGGGSNPLTGYSLINADSIDGACDMAKGCPVLQNSGSVEVAEAIDM